MTQPQAWERVMGLDFGERRIGIAYATVMGLGSTMVLPAGFLEVQQTWEATIEDLVDMVEEEGVDAIVVGVPYINGQENKQTARVLEHAKALRAALPADIEMYGWDESYSSASAQSLLVGAELKHSGKSKRGRVDAVAAALILQSFMDAHRNMGLAPGALLI